MTDFFLAEIQHNLEKHLSDDTFGLRQLCRAVCMSRTKLFRQLKARVHVSPSRYIRFYRLAHARTLLETTNFPVSEIAYRVGFRDPDYFSRAFRQYYGLQPTATRREAA